MNHVYALTRRALAGSACAFTLLLLSRHARADDKQQKVIVFGDSQAQGLAGGMQRLLRTDHQRRVLDRSKISTGLIPRPSYDWIAQSRVVAGEHGTVAVAMFGANDRPPVRVGGHVDPALLTQFTRFYGGRVAEVAEDFRDASVPLLWVGHPIVRDPAFSDDMRILNDIYADRAVAAGAHFVSTWDIFKGDDGNYSPYGRGVDGQTTRLRADDGVHLTAAGYDVISALLSPMLQV
jgi:hypothetical protein